MSAVWEALLRSLQYKHISTTPASGNRTFYIRFKDSNNRYSNTASSIISVSFALVIDLDTGSDGYDYTASYVYEPTDIAEALSLTGSDVASVVITPSGIVDGVDEVFTVSWGGVDTDFDLSVDTTTTLTGVDPDPDVDVAVSSGVMTLSIDPSAHVSVWQIVLAGLSYSHASLQPTFGDRVFTLQMFGPTGLVSNLAERTVSIDTEALDLDPDVEGTGYIVGLCKDANGDYIKDANGDWVLEALNLPMEIAPNAVVRGRNIASLTITPSGIVDAGEVLLLEWNGENYSFDPESDSENIIYGTQSAPDWRAVMSSSVLTIYETGKIKDYFTGYNSGTTITSGITLVMDDDGIYQATPVDTLAAGGRFDTDTWYPDDGLGSDLYTSNNVGIDGTISKIYTEASFQGALIQPSSANMVDGPCDYSGTTYWTNSGFTVTTATSCIAGQTAYRHENQGGGTSRLRTQDIGTLSTNAGVLSIIVENVDATRTTFGLYDITGSAYFWLVDFDFGTKEFLSHSGDGGDEAETWYEDLGTGPNGGATYRLFMKTSTTSGNSARVNLAVTYTTVNTLTAILHHCQYEEITVGTSPIASKASRAATIASRAASGNIVDGNYFAIYLRLVMTKAGQSDKTILGFYIDADNYFELNTDNLSIVKSVDGSISTVYANHTLTTAPVDIQFYQHGLYGMGIRYRVYSGSWGAWSNWTVEETAAGRLRIAASVESVEIGSLNGAKIISAKIPFFYTKNLLLTEDPKEVLSGF